MDRYYRSPYPNELWHHGIKGQRWGLRRFQNEDGTLTPAGRERYGKYADSSEKKQWAKTSEYEKQMAREETGWQKKLNRKENRLEKAINEHASSKTIEKKEHARRKAELGLKAVQEKADKYYSLNIEDQKFIQKQYDGMRYFSIVNSYLFGVASIPASLLFAALTESEINKKLNNQ